MLKLSVRRKVMPFRFVSVPVPFLFIDEEWNENEIVYVKDDNGMFIQIQRKDDKVFVIGYNISLDFYKFKHVLSRRKAGITDLLKESTDVLAICSDTKEAELYAKKANLPWGIISSHNGAKVGIILSARSEDTSDTSNFMLQYA